MKKFLLTSILSCGVGLGFAQATDYITVADASGAAGSSITLNVDMTNPTITPCAYQCDIVLPDGVTVVPNTLEVASRASGHIIASNVLSDGSYRILCYSMSNAAITGTEGTVATFDVALGDALENGTYTFSVVNTEIVDADCVAKIVADAVNSDLTVGNTGTSVDLNNDGKVDAVDLSIEISHVLSNNSLGDLNGDGKVDAVDLSLVINAVLGL